MVMPSGPFTWRDWGGPAPWQQAILASSRCRSLLAGGREAPAHTAPPHTWSACLSTQSTLPYIWNFERLFRMWVSLSVWVCLVCMDTQVWNFEIFLRTWVSLSVWVRLLCMEAQAPAQPYTCILTYTLSQTVPHHSALLWPNTSTQHFLLLCTYNTNASM